MKTEPNTNPGPGPGPCVICGKPATCYSVNYENPEHAPERACNVCCDHDPCSGPCERDWVCEPIRPYEGGT